MKLVGEVFPLVPSDTATYALALTDRGFVFDALTLPYVLDEPYRTRCMAAGVNAVNVTLTGEDGWDETIRSFDSLLNKIENCSNVVLARNATELVAAYSARKLAVVLGTQGAAMIGDDLCRVGFLARLGIRIIGLAYTPANLLADGCGERRNAGLSTLGQEFVAAVNEQPMILDLSHAGHVSRLEAAQLARAPACTHSNAFSVTPNDRNTQDDTVSLIAAKKGLVSICCLPRTVSPVNPSIKDVIDHCDHFVRIAGAHSVGVGLDYQQGDQERRQQMAISKRWRMLRPDIFGTVEDYYAEQYPSGLEEISLLPNLTRELIERGYDERSIKGILGRNWLKFFSRVAP